MKQITIYDLMNGISETEVQIMTTMESAQTEEWKDLYNKMTFEQKEIYYNLKDKLFKSVVAGQKDAKAEQLAFYKYGVEHGNFAFTLEHYFDLAGEHILIGNIEENVGSKAYEIVRRLREVRTKDEVFTFFWQTHSPFSQWHKSSFNGPSFLFINTDRASELLGHSKQSLDFISAEQFMMYHKAILFIDTKVANDIMSIDNSRKIKELGRAISNYDESTWQFFRSKVVYEGNKAKFTQNEALKQALFATQGTTLVEAAPNDNIWGIGLASDDPRAFKRKTWQGKNLLGEILTQLRVELLGTY